MLFVFASIYPVSMYAQAGPTAEIGVTNYNRHEEWTYTCEPTFAASISYLGRQLSRTIGQIAGVFGFNQPIAQSPTLCPGSGGIEKSVIDATWSQATGGKVIETETTAPRYGSQTCVITVIWEKTRTGLPSLSELGLENGLPVSVQNSCTGELYTREKCSGKPMDWNSCIVLNAYGTFPKHIIEIGNGASAGAIRLDNVLVRRMNFSVNARLGLRIAAIDRGLYEVVIQAPVWQIYDYLPPFVDNTTYRVLGWNEYTVAGKQVGKFRWNAYKVTLKGRNRDLIDVTPVPKNSLPLYFFNGVSIVSIRKIPDQTTETY